MESNSSSGSRSQKKHQLNKLKQQINKYEWTENLDKFLQESVIRNYFNFDMVSLELNEEVKKLNLNFGATNIYTNEKARYRWSYLHTKRQLNEPVKYKERKEQPHIYQNNIRNNSQNIDPRSRNSQVKQSQSHHQPETSSKAKPLIESEPLKLAQQKNFNNLIEIKEPKSYGDIERQLWKKNITMEHRQKKDVLDVSNEDFSKHKTITFDGREIMPSNFNIFRDSLRDNSEQLLKTLQENLPEMNLNEIEAEESEDNEEEEVLPLDFRTAFIEEENKVVIQAKPLQLKTDAEILKSAYEEEQNKGFETTEQYLEAVKKEPFKDENVILIDPDINIKEKFDQIDLLCNREQRINNQFHAPRRTLEEIERLKTMLSPKEKAPLSKKQYDTDTEGENEDPKPISKKDQLNFDSVLKQWGVTDINKLIGTSSDDEKQKKKQQKQPQPTMEKPQQEEEKKEPVKGAQKERQVDQRVGIIQSIMEENRRAQQAKKDNEQMPTSIHMMLDALTTDQVDIKEDKKTKPVPKVAEKESEEDSDVAPMSALVDEPTKEEIKKKEDEKFQKSVKLASSDSEQSGDEQKTTSKKKVQFANKSSGSESEEQIDTSSKPKKAKKKRVVSYKGVKIQSEDEGSEDENEEKKGESTDSADEYFNQQRKLIKKKLIGNKDLQKEYDKTDYNSGNDQQVGENDRAWDDDMGDFDNMMEKSIKEAERVQREEQEKARIEAERLRMERLRQQEEMLRRDQEKKRKEFEEFQEKLKRQDEERKKRKKEEKERKKEEKERQRKLEEQRMMQEMEKREEEEEKEKKKRQEEERVKREKERERQEKLENQRRKENFEKQIKKIWNGSDIQCLFDSKIAYTKQLYNLPVDLEISIQKQQVPNEDLVFRRYKTLLIPIDGLISKTSGSALIELTEYFLRHSTLKIIDHTFDQSEEDQDQEQDTQFPFKCIGLVQTIALPPFNKCSLSSVSPYDPNAYRVLAVLFDTYDNPKTKQSFQDTLKQTRLDDILSSRSLSELSQAYPNFLSQLAFDYMQSSKLKEFPYKINASKAPLIDFENPDDQSFSHDEALGKIAFFMEYSMQDDVMPQSTKESWDFIRRQPTFYAYNPNPKSYSKQDAKAKIISKYNNFKNEHLCVIFKDFSYKLNNPSDSDFHQHTKSKSAIEFFLKKATMEAGLEIVGMRMIYLDQEQISLYQSLFYEKLAHHSGEHSLFAVFVRGVDAIQKCEQIVGHFSPDLARKTQEKSVRAFFGRDKDHNCVLKMFSSQKKNLSEQIFWFGGRVQQDSETQQILQSEESMQVPMNTMYIVVPARVEKQFMFLSPLITTKQLPTVLQVLTDFGVTVLDIQKINYEKFLYEGENIQGFNKNLAIFELKGQTYNIQIGFMLHISRESLLQKYPKICSKIQKKLQESSIDTRFGSIFYMTQSVKEYKTVKQKLKINQINVNYSKYQIEHLQPKPISETKDYDSEDTEHYNEINLFNVKPKKGGFTQNMANDYNRTSTFMCFVKLSLFRKDNFDQILDQIINKAGFELIGVKILNARRQIYSELVPREVRTIIKKIAYKFNESYPDLKLRKKVLEFKSLVLVLRARNVEQKIDTIYDKIRLKFTQDLNIYEALPQVIFLTNQEVTEKLLDFMLNSKFIKLYNDFTIPHDHIMSSQTFSYMLNYNAGAIDPIFRQQFEERGYDDDQNVIHSVSNIVAINDKEHLFEVTDSDKQ